MTAIGKDMDRNLRLGEGSPFFDIVLPCGGGITLTIHVLRDATVLHLALTALDRRTPMRLRYHPGKRTLSVAPGEDQADGMARTFTGVSTETAAADRRYTVGGPGGVAAGSCLRIRGCRSGAQ